jgi:L-iditol 2-dehydrogenase
MKALVYLGPASMEYREVPDLDEKDGEVIVEVASCGICGSDMHGWHGTDPRRVPPLVMGHEAAGWIRTGKRAGERVVINPQLACMRCDRCLAGQPHLCGSKDSVGLPPRSGAFADFVRVPERNAIPIPDDMDFATAALTEPVAVAYRAVGLIERLHSRPIAAQRGLVIGGGAIGLAAALILRARNVPDVLLAGTNARRREAALAAGLTQVFDPRGKLPADGSVDFVIDSVGSRPSRELASRAVRFGGVIAHLGLAPGNEGLDVRRITLGEIIFTGVFCYTWLDFKETIALLDRGGLGPLTWVRERPMREGRDAFAAIGEGTTPAVKIVLCNE